MVTREVDLHEQLETTEAEDVNESEMPITKRQKAIKLAKKQVKEGRKKIKELQQQTGPAVKSGAATAVDATGVLLQHSNPFALARTYGFWSMLIGTGTIIVWVVQLVGGGASGISDRRPLPTNAPVAMRIGHGITATGTPIVTAVVTSTSSSINQGVRVQLASDQPRQLAPTNVSATNTATAPAVAITRYTGQ